MINTHGVGELLKVIASRRAVVFLTTFEAALPTLKLSPYFISRAKSIQESSRDVSVISLSLIKKELMSVDI